MIQIYRGYYKRILLAVSTDKKKVKTYLKDIRQLDEYDIEDSYMEYENAEKLYSEYFLIEYLKDIYITNSDAELLDLEIEKEFNKYVDILNDMRMYYNRISKIPIMEKHAKHLEDTIHNMEDDLTSKKVLKKLRKEIIKRSGVFSYDINEYQILMRNKKLCEELDNMYRYRLYDTD